jgi:hypothetical protein
LFSGGCCLNSASLGVLRSMLPWVMSLLLLLLLLWWQLLRPPATSTVIDDGCG